MRRDRFYLPFVKAKSEITNSGMVHKICKVLRKNPGDFIYAFDGEGREYLLELMSVDFSGIEFKVQKVVKDIKRKGPFISLGFSLLKSKKNDFVFQKATEIGVDGFIPFISDHTVVKVPGNSKKEHYKKVIFQAVSQSGRLFIPEVSEVCGLEDFIAEKFEDYDVCLAADFKKGQTLEKSLTEADREKVKNILLVVGPEGGFSDTEMDLLSDNKKVRFVRISDYTLRAETACLVFPYLVRQSFA